MLAAAQAVDTSSFDEALTKLSAADIVLAGLALESTDLGDAAMRLRKSLKDQYELIEKRRNLSKLENSNRRVINLRTGRTDHGG